MSDEEYKRVFSKNLNKLLQKSGKTQKEVADHLEIGVTTLNNCCVGIALPRMGKVQALANYFGVEKSDLIEDKPESEQHYYLNDEAREMAEFLFKNPDYKIIGYFEQYQEAYDALAEYNKNPYDIDAKNLTFADVYEAWSKRKFTTLVNGKLPGESSIASTRAAYKKFAGIHNMKFCELNSLTLQNVFDNCPSGRATMENMCVVLHGMYTYAIEFDIVQKDWSSFVTITKADTESVKKPFTEFEIKKLWKRVGDPLADDALILIYTGMRIREYLTLTPEQLHLNERYLTAG